MLLQLLTLFHAPIVHLFALHDSEDDESSPKKNYICFHESTDS